MPAIGRHLTIGATGRKPTQRGVIYALAPSPLGHQPHLGGHRRRPDLAHDRRRRSTGTTSRRRELTPWQKVSVIEASHSDPQTAYAAINTLRLDDLRPHIYRTHDGGKTWTEIINGIPDDENRQRGARRSQAQRAAVRRHRDARSTSPSMMAITGNRLRLNMPATSVRDLVIKDDDLLVGTHGRGFWILDDITPLRQIGLTRSTSANAYLFAPQTALRVRWNTNTDTPLPPDVPAGTESAGRRDHRLLPEVGVVRPGDAGDSGQLRQGDSHVRQQRSRAAA